MAIARPLYGELLLLDEILHSIAYNKNRHKTSFKKVNFSLIDKAVV